MSLPAYTLLSPQKTLFSSYEITLIHQGKKHTGGKEAQTTGIETQAHRSVEGFTLRLEIPQVLLCFSAVGIILTQSRADNLECVSRSP